MKTLVLFTLVSVALAAPALQEEATDHLQDLPLQAHRSIPESVKREKKSPTELKSSTILPSSAPNSEILTDVGIPIQTGRSFGLKTPVIVKKKYGYHLYRDSSEEKANADSHEHCGRQVKVKLCDEDGKFRKILRSHDFIDSTSENDMKHSIMMAREAIENLQRDFKKIEQKSVSGNLDETPNTDLHEDIEETRQALEDIHKNFENLETMSLRATTLRDTDGMQNLHIRIANTEKEKMAQWKAAIDNINQNVEIAQNIENSFKTANDEENPLHLHQAQATSTKTDNKIMVEEDHMRNTKSNNQKLQNNENSNKNVEQDRDKTSFLHAREEQESMEDIASSASEVIEMKAVDIANHHSLRSENHKRVEPEKNIELDLKEQEIGVHNMVTHNEDRLNKNAEEKLVDPLTDIQNAASSTDSTFTDGPKHERKTDIINIGEKISELHSHEKKLEENNIKNELNEEIMTAAEKTTQNIKSKLEDHHSDTTESSQSVPKKTEEEKIDDNQTFDEQIENSMKAAAPTNVIMNDLHLEGKHQNIDYNDSEHTAALTEMKSAGDHLHHIESIDLNEQSHENRPLSLMKTAEPSDIEHHNIDYNESEHTAAITKMKTAENNFKHEVAALKSLEAVEDNLHQVLFEPLNSHGDHETRSLISLKTADPSDQVLLNDLHLQHNHNIDYNESEHTATLTELKTAEDDISHQVTLLKALDAMEHNLHHEVSEPFNAPWSHGPLSIMKTADPFNQVPINDFHLHHTHQNNDENELEHMATFTQMKTPENHLSHQKPFSFDTEISHESGQMTVMKAARPFDQAVLNNLHLQRKHNDLDHNESGQTAPITEMKSAEDDLSHHITALHVTKAVEDHFRHPEAMTTNVNWKHNLKEKQPLTTMKMADPTNKLSLDHHHLHHKLQKIGHDDSEHTAKLIDMKTFENQVHPHLTATEMKATEDDLHHLQSFPSTLWDHENRLLPSMKTVEDFRRHRHELDQMRNSHVADHHFTHNNVGHSFDFDSSEHVHQHANFPHRLHHNLVHPDVHDIHGTVPSHFHPSLRDAMEGLESEHVFRWKPSHERFRSSYAPNPISSGGAVGVFPNANTGGCGIPLLLSCSPSVVSGSLAKAHGTSYSSPSYSAPSYRAEEDFGFHNKRDTKKTNEMRTNNILRSPTIVKQKTSTVLDRKI